MIVHAITKYDRPIWLMNKNCDELIKIMYNLIQLKLKGKIKIIY